MLTTSEANTLLYVPKVDNLFLFIARHDVWCGKKSHCGKRFSGRYNGLWWFL